MARYRKYRRSRGGGGGFGMGGIVKPAIYGFIASKFLPSVVPVSPSIAGAVGGYFANKSIMGGLVGYFVPTVLGGALGQSTSQQAIVYY